MSGNGRGAGRGSGAAGAEESPAGRSLGLIVPRTQLFVVTMDGPLQGLVLPNETWNRKVRIAGLHWRKHGRVHPVLGYGRAEAVELVGVRYGAPMAVVEP